MKYQICVPLILLAFSFSNCSKTDGPSQPPSATSPNTPVNGSVDLSKGTILKQGTFSGNMSYRVHGKVQLYDVSGKQYIYFEDFSASSGPDLKVYIATTNTASQFVSLGPIKSINGAQLYEISNPPDFNQYNKVLIWCQQFSVLFGAASLQ